MNKIPRPTRFNRTKIAQVEFRKIFSDIKHPMYFVKDSELSKKFKINRHTVRTIREDIGVPSRAERIYSLLKDTPIKNKTINELSEQFGVKYQCLYRIIKDKNLTVKQSL